MAKTFLLALVAGLLTAAISLSWTSLAINDHGSLRIQDFAHQFLLVNAKACATSEYPYSPERRASVIHKVCQEIVDQNCEAPENPHPIGISPAGLSIFKALGFTFGHDLKAAFHAYILVVFLTLYLAGSLRRTVATATRETSCNLRLDRYISEQICFPSYSSRAAQPANRWGYRASSNKNWTTGYDLESHSSCFVGYKTIICRLYLSDRCGPKRCKIPSAGISGHHCSTLFLYMYLRPRDCD